MNCRLRLSAGVARGVSSRHASAKPQAEKNSQRRPSLGGMATASAASVARVSQTRAAAGQGSPSESCLPCSGSFSSLAEPFFGSPSLSKRGSGQHLVGPRSPDLASLTPKDPTTFPFVERSRVKAPGEPRLARSAYDGRGRSAKVDKCALFAALMHPGITRSPISLADHCF